MTKLSGFASPSTIISRAFACQPHVHDAPALQAPDDDARHAWIIKPHPYGKGVVLSTAKIWIISCCWVLLVLAFLLIAYLSHLFWQSLSITLDIIIRFVGNLFGVTRSVVQCND